MSDVLFACQECSKHFVVDEAAKGKALKCSDCGKPIQVPANTIPTECPACSWKVLVAPQILGKTFNCPNCEEPFVIPVAAPHNREQVHQMRPFNLSATIEPSSSTHAHNQKLCRFCNAVMSTNAYACPKCGRSSIPYKAPEPVSDNSRPILRHNQKTCPFCSEQIMVDAIKCKHCGEFLSNNDRASKPRYSGGSSRRPNADYNQMAGRQPPYSDGATPINVRWGVGLLWASLLLSTILGQDYSSSGDGPSWLGMIIGISFGAFLISKISKGRNWARIISLILTILSIIGFPFVLALPNSSELFSSFDLLWIASDLAGIIFLFTPSANDWFRVKKEG